MPYKYATKDYSKEHMARAVGIGLPISTKQSIEICKYLKGKRLDTIKKELQEVIDGKKAIPFTRFNRDMGHKKKIGPGRFPKKSCTEILRLIESTEANAQFKGLNTADLVLYSIVANKAHSPWHFGRQRRRKMKRTHIEIVLKEEKKKQERKKDNGKKESVKKKQSTDNKKSETNKKTPINKQKSETKTNEKQPEVKKE